MDGFAHDHVHLKSKGADVHPYYPQTSGEVARIRHGLPP
jgi:hypothetical protein